MSVVSGVLGFLLRQLGRLVAIVLVLFVGYVLIQFLVPSLQDAMADRGRLEQVSKERAVLEKDIEELRAAAEEGDLKAIESLAGRLEAEVETGRRELSEKQAEVKELLDKQQDACDFVGDLIDLVTPGSACEAAENAARKAQEARDTLEESLAKAEEDFAVLADPDLTSGEKLDRLGEGGGRAVVQRELANKQSELSQKEAEEQSLKEVQESWAGWLVDHWARSWKWLLATALLVLVMPSALRTVSYFLLMPLVRRIHTPIHLAAGSEMAVAELRTAPAQRTLTIHLGDGEVLSARSEHVRPVQGKVRSQLVYQWRSPFISIAAGLHGLSRIVGGDRLASATLASPDDPNSYLMRIDFTNHPGLVMHPKHVVGVIGTPQLITRWRWGLQALATGQLRYILFAGTGGLVVQGSGDVVETNPRGGSTRIEQHLVMGFDSRLKFGVHRTEVFWPYLRRKTPLVDDEFTGVHPLFWQKSSTAGPSNPIAKSFDAFFSAFGKLLGF